MEVDVAMVGDFRFPGGTSTAIVAETRALARAGYRVGLVALASGPLAARRPIHPEIAALARDGAAAFVPQGTAVRAGLACLHHPAVFERLPAVAPLVEARKTVLVVHHPPVDAVGSPQYDIGKIARITADLFGPGIAWAPVGPAVRTALAALHRPPLLHPADWVNVIDPAELADLHPRLPGALPVLGRHSRPEPVKWPDDRETLLAAYPAAEDIRVRLMGWGPELDRVLGPRPANWEVLPFGAEPLRAFLGSIDYFAHYHGSTWIEAFGRSVLEAMAAGRVCILPPGFEPVFGEGAVYGPASAVAGTIRRFEADPAAYRAQAERAVATVSRRYGPDRAVNRVRDLIGPPACTPAQTATRTATPTAAAPKPGAGSILFFTSNGIGMGHLTRAMAVARRLEPGLTPVIVTMSKAFDVVREAGIAVEYLPYFRALGIDHGAWDAKLEREVTEVLRHHRPDVLVFDGNVPYDGMLRALDGFPAIWRVWLRRPLWRPGSGADQIAKAPRFDVVVEPGELADPVDRGPTKARQGEVLRVDPVRLLDPQEALPRDAARRLLGIGPDRVALLAQLGSGNNADFGEVLSLLARLCDPARNAPPADLFVARWRISESPAALPGHVRQLDTFPIARWLAAFDASVAVAGYNTFHENLAAGLPTLFLSNDHPEQDEQGLRADYAALRGLALAARPTDMPAVRRGISALLERATRDRLRAATARVDWANGAAEVARFLAGLAVSRKPGLARFEPADVGA